MIPTGYIIGTLIFICLAVVATFITILVIINMNDDSANVAHPGSIIDICPKTCQHVPVITTTTTCSKEGCATTPEGCTPGPLNTCFATVQSLSSANLGTGNLNFGKSTVSNTEFLAAGQENTDGVTSTVFIYQNLFFDQVNVPPQYVLAKTIIVTGTNPLVAMYRQIISAGNRTFLTVVTTTPAGGSIKEYIHQSSLWSIYGEGTLAEEPTFITQYLSTAAIVSNSTVYLFSGGVINATIANLNAVSVSVDGNSAYTYMLIGCIGSAYLFTSVGTSMASWGTPIKSYNDDTYEFGKIVSLQLPYFIISDFNVQTEPEIPVQSRVIVYTTCNLDIPQAYIMTDSSIDDYNTTIIGGVVYIWSLGHVQMYSKKSSVICPGDWIQTYLWSFENTDRTEVSGHGKTIVINNTMAGNYASLTLQQISC
jgi:hypothetical protein